MSGGTLTTPVNLPSVSDVAFMDGYFVWTIAGGDQFIISGINKGTIYDPLDVATVESLQPLDRRRLRLQPEPAQVRGLQLSVHAPS